MLKKLFDKFRQNPIQEYDDSALMATANRLPHYFVRGEGSVLWGEDNKQYIDAMSGNAVTILGHNHPQISKAISLQANKLLQLSNNFHIKERAQLAIKFCQISQMDKASFGNSSNDSIETAIEIASQHGIKKGIKSPAIIVTEGSTYRHNLAVSTNNVETSVTELIKVTHNDIDAVGAQTRNQNVVAVMVDSVVGSTGCLTDKAYWSSLRALCDEHGWWLIANESPSGLGRTGEWFAYQLQDALPDIMISGNALGNGIAISACAACGDAAEVLTFDDFDNVFDGNPFACQVALATIKIIEDGNLLATAKETADYLKKQIQHQIGAHDSILSIRSQGLLLAIELEQRTPELALRLLEAGLVAKVIDDGKIIKLLPALNISREQAKQIAKIIHDVVISL